MLDGAGWSGLEIPCGPPCGISRVGAGKRPLQGDERFAYLRLVKTARDPKPTKAPDLPPEVVDRVLTVMAVAWRRKLDREAAERAAAKPKRKRQTAA